MHEDKINEDYLLLLVENNGKIETTTISIDNHFKPETEILNNLCNGNNDNIEEIIFFIRNTLQPKLPNKNFNYCKELDKAYQSVLVNIESKIQDITAKKDWIYVNQKKAQTEEEEFNIENEFENFKSYIRENIEFWFIVFNTEFAYEKAKKIPNMLVYSHRISGWSKPEYQITENLKQQLKTNFGYGSVSYFYCLLTFKNIQITPLSEWIDYRFANFSEVIRYTKSFKKRVPVLDEKERLKYYKTKIENRHWFNAIEFTKNAANLLLTNEEEFVKKYIIEECENMVKGLEKFYTETEYEFIDENEIPISSTDIKRYRVNFKGYELIDFRTEKIIGALDFLDKIIAYNSICNTQKYTDQIIELNKKFIPKVYSTQEIQHKELKIAKKEYDNFLLVHNQVIEKNKFYNEEKGKLKNKFEDTYKEEYKEFMEKFKKYNNELLQHNHKMKLHTDNINRLTNYISKYKEIVQK